MLSRIKLVETESLNQHAESVRSPDEIAAIGLDGRWRN
jgi:hypothetical protein